MFRSRHPVLFRIAATAATEETRSVCEVRSSLQGEATAATEETLCVCEVHSSLQGGAGRLI